ncbi:demethylmenaquinone methyltransferase [Virgisporangium ochraceum]|uniref:Demethylmenaquinone methyltransferase n=1 Tax=Virgisporangium ochraceum TaxID=65505 RepID=A0A8J4E9H3_9ACTN|nr:demethylmenaquinone methyltransferase [Virgisporangium ochraceum]
MEKEPHEVAAMFDGVAEKYDRTNTVLALGRDRMWRRRTREALGLRPGDRVLDLAAGTGVSTEELARSGAYAVGADFSVGMLRVGRRARPSVPLVAADALALPFADASFDAVTISFGLRNIADPIAALREMARVTRPGGRLLVCEFSHPVLAPLRAAYLGGVLRALPVVARRVASNPDAYVYLAESIPAWPDQKALAALIQEAGWSKVAWRNLTGGVVAMHRAFRP